MADPWNTREELTLTGTHVRLEPLSPRHVPALEKISLDPEIWRFTGGTQPSMAVYVDRALQERDRGESIPFIIRALPSREILGTTRFYSVAPANRNLEIGYTWLVPAVWRTRVNTECKYLLLRHAFEAMGCLRVALRTDFRNLRSRAAIARLGASQEGIFRKHMIMADGYVRDTVYFSLVDDEWPAVKAALEAKLVPRGPGKA
jgi:RimJ/RimL family protein N-acetyltransferase